MNTKLALTTLSYKHFLDGDLFGELSPVLRPYLPTEEKQIRELILMVLKENGFTYDPILNYDLDHLTEIYKNKRSQMFTIVSHGQVIGTNGIVDEGENAYWRRLTLAKSFRGNGWLYPQANYTIKYCRDQGFKLIHLDTLRRFGIVPSLEKIGCKIIKSQKEREDTKIFMELQL